MDVIFTIPAIAVIMYNNGLLYPRRIKIDNWRMGTDAIKFLNNIQEMDHRRCYRGKNQRCVRNENYCPFKDPNNYYESYFGL